MKRPIFYCFILSFIVVLFCPFSYGQYTIHLRSGAVTPPPNAQRYLDSLLQAGGEQEPQQVLVTFTTLPTTEQRELLKQSGLNLLEYIPDNTFLAVLSMPLNREKILLTPVYSIVGTRADWKSGGYLWKYVSGKKGAVEVLVSFCAGVSPEEIRQFVSTMGGTINAGPLEKFGNYKVVIDAARVRSMAQWYGVRFINPVSDIVPLDVQSRPAVKGNIAVAPPVHGGYGLAGDSVTVGVGDNASGIYHVDLNERIRNFNPAPMETHGEHVNGIVGSAAIVDPAAASMAPHVSLIDYLYDLILPDVGTMYHDYNMTITNNSYEIIAGDCDYAGVYDGYSQLLDTLAILYPFVNNVFAAGNDGYMKCPPFDVGFATIGGGYQPAKNNIVVGSMTDFQLKAIDESRGPMVDGRLKPEIVAVGLGAYSTVGVDNYAWSAGTSMASPQAAGGLAILTQRYKQLYSTQPRADVLKSILLNGAMDVGNPGPDFSYGFGIMDIARSLKIIDSGRFGLSSVNNGDSQTYSITVHPNTGQLKILLCWYDVPGSGLSAKALVNDLDLTVTDPSSVVHLPLVVDQTPANNDSVAKEKTDHLNNTEQVVINNPAAGTYTVKIKGYSVPYGPQQFAMSYDIIPNGTFLTFPIGGEQLANSTNSLDSTRFFWNGVNDGNTFKVELSTDNGSNWTVLSNNVPANVRRHDFIASGISSGKCLARVSRNNTSEVSASQRFVINTPPTVALDTAQCPGYINIHWSPVVNAASYYLLKKVGMEMRVVDSTTDTVYSFSGMPLDRKSYVAVQPVIDGLPGYRSMAAIATANNGNCTKTVSNGDLLIEGLASPNAGRMHTSSEYTGSSAVNVRLRDMYSTPCSSYTLSYTVNGGPWQTLTDPGAIPANGTVAIALPGISLTTPGTYTVTVAVHNNALPDPQHSNDTTSFRITNIVNDTINLALPYFDGFEGMGATSVVHDSMGISPDGHWDFHSDSFGRVRSFVNDGITIAGNRSMSLDQDRNLLPGSKNQLTGTFNFSNFDTATAEIRLDFDYVLHGRPRSGAGNIVQARASDTSAWVPVYSYDLSAYPGFLTHARSLSLTDAMRQQHRNFSSSSQVSFGQSDTSLIAAINYGNGITLDNFRLYTVANDASLVSIVSPLPSDCGLASPQPLTVRVHNGVNNTLHNILMSYSLDGGTIYTGTIDSILPKATIDFTFSQQLDVSMGITHNLNVWLNVAGDTYKANDSIMNYHFRNSVIVSAFPYLENFETGDGGYYSDGFKNSWQYGTPASTGMHKAASGTKAWKTNLAGHYNNLELSYLYSPCFDISGLTNPMLSFSAALDIENCGNTLCDAAYVECSFDGSTWTKLGSTGQGTNWYNPAFNVWNTEGFSRWHVASVPLPQPGPGIVLHLRFVLAADPGVTFEGLAIDDIHIFDKKYGIHPSDQAAANTQDLNANQRTEFTADNSLLASVDPRNQNINSTVVMMYTHDTVSNPGGTQYTFPRSYTVKAPQQPADSARIRLYLLESDLLQVLNDTTCASCNKVSDAYSLGITQFDNNKDPNTENSTLADDTGGVFTYYPYKVVQWVPYDSGYYAEVTAKPFSEFWFNDGGPTGNFPAGTDYLNFTAFRNGSNVTASWYSLIDTVVNIYTPQWSTDSANFADIMDVAPRHLPIATYSIDDPVNFSTHPELYYRLRWTMTGNSAYHYSPVRKVTSADSATTGIVFNAAQENHSDVVANWTSLIDGAVNHYVLERAIGSGSYKEINTTQSLHRYGQSYSYIDAPGKIAAGTVIHYRLTAVMEDNSTIVLPERTVIWVNGNSIVNVYPNPTTDGSITIDWHADFGVLMQINISDAVGKSIYSLTVPSAGWSNSTTIQTFTHPKGMYFMSINIGGHKFVRKLVYL